MIQVFDNNREIVNPFEMEKKYPNKYYILINTVDDPDYVYKGELYALVDDTDINSQEYRDILKNAKKITNTTATVNHTYIDGEIREFF